MKIEIREILKKDNLKIKEVLVSVMNEFRVPDEGTAMQDEELNFMFESYQDKNSKYYIVLADNFISGGAGISKLKGTKAVSYTHLRAHET